MRRPSATVVWAFGSKNLGYFFLWRAEQTTLYSASIFQPRGEAIHLIMVHAHTYTSAEMPLYVSITAYMCPRPCCVRCHTFTLMFTSVWRDKGYDASAEMNGDKSADSLGSESSTAVKDCRSLRPVTGRPTSRSYFCFIVRLRGCHVSPQFGFCLSTATLFTVAALNVQHSAFGVNCITRQTALPYYRRKRKVN